MRSFLSLLTYRIGVVGLALAAASGTAAAQGASPAAPMTVPWLGGDAGAGAVTFGAQCSGCHAAPGGMAGLVAGATPEDKGRSLWTFLAGHFVPDEAVRANVVAYLLRESGDAGVRIGDAAAGEMGYAVTCVGCHASGERIARQVPGDGLETKAAWLWSFLAGHHAADEELRADLLGYLLAAIEPLP